MPFKSVPQNFTSAINTVTLGTGAEAIELGGENILPLYSFDAPIKNTPKVGIELSDLGPRLDLPHIAEYFAGADTLVNQAIRACEMPGVDFLCLVLDSADPNGKNASIKDCAAVCKEVADAINKPLAIIGCSNAEKDGELLPMVAEVLQNKNVLLLSAKEDNYKSISAAAGLAYGQKFGAESSVDLNLAKQLNVLINQLGVKSESVVMDIGSAAAGYGFEYISSTIERVKSAALAQNDQMLQMPIITIVARDAWTVKESTASESDFPEWGPVEQRGIGMEIATASACLAAGSNAVILMHPDSVSTVSKLISSLLIGGNYGS